MTSPGILEAVVCDESHFTLYSWEFKISSEPEIIEKQELMERDFTDFSGFIIQVQLLLGSIRENQHNSRKM